MDDVFRQLEQLAGSATQGAKHGVPWCVARTSESCSLICRREHPIAELNGQAEKGSDEIIVIAGRQIVVREGLEVLALCTSRRLPLGRSLKSTLEAVIRAKAIPVLPWGFGKWRFGRGTLVRKVLESGFNKCVYVGDNGNRLALSREPALFRLAAERGVRVLPGSDPFPMRRRVRDAGRYGFYLRGEVDPDRPGAWIRRALAEPDASIEPFGERAGVVQFCVSQSVMQFRRWLR